jgi:hypothetical protein
MDQPIGPTFGVAQRIQGPINPAAITTLLHQHEVGRLLTAPRVLAPSGPTCPAQGQEPGTFGMAMGTRRVHVVHLRV